MDFIFTAGIIVIIMALTYIYIQNTYSPYLIILAGILMILIGIPFMTGDTIESNSCDYITTETTLTGNVTTYTNTLSCYYSDLNIFNGFYNVLGAFFILGGLGMTLIVHQKTNIWDGEER